MSTTSIELSSRTAFCDADWNLVPACAGAYVIWDLDEIVYVGMAGRNGRGGLRNRLRDHASGQIVNMFAQYLFLAKVQFLSSERIIHPRQAKEACRRYTAERCAFQYCIADSASHARSVESHLRRTLRPTLNPCD